MIVQVFETVLRENKEVGFISLAGVIQGRPDQKLDCIRDNREEPVF